jgi:hypothetical protein
LDIPIRATTVGGILHDGVPPSGANPNTFPAHTEYSDPYNAEFEYMREESGARYAWKGVEHYTRRCNEPLVPIKQAGWNDYSQTSSTSAWWEFYGLPPSSVWNGTQGNSISEGGQLGQMDYPVSGLPLLYEENDLVRSVLPTISMKEYTDRAMRSMMPSIKGGFSIGNDAVELKDLRSLPRSVQNAKFLAERLGLLFPPRSRWGRKSLSKLIPAVSDLYLQYKFNIRPTLTDIAKGYTAMRNVDKQLKRLINEADKPLLRHFRLGITDNLGAGETLVENSGNSNNFYYIGGTQYQRLTSVGLAMYNATMEYSYKLPSMTSQELRALALADYFGLNLDPSIIWNALPWSFVVDWTTGVSQWLSQFSINNVRPLVNIRRFCASLHVERTILSYCTPNWNSIHEGGPALCSQVWEKAFRRVAHSPDLYSSITSSGINPDEFILGAALAGTRL